MQNFSTTSTQITDTNGNVVLIDNSQLQTKEKTINDFLQQQTSSLESIRTYLENVSQASNAVSVSIPKDNIINTTIMDTEVTGTITRPSLSGNIVVPGSYVEIPIDGHSIITTQIGTTTGNNVVGFQVTTDGVNWTQPKNGFISNGRIVDTYISTSGQSSIYFLCCAGYSKVRFLVRFQGFGSEVKVTMRASYGVPFNYLMYSLMTSRDASNVETAYNYSSVYGVFKLPNMGNRGYVAQNTINLSGPTWMKGSATPGNNSLYGITTNNPNDFTVYLIFWSSASTTITSFDVSAQSVSYYIPIPTGTFVIPPNFYGLYFSSHLYAAISMSSSCYIPVPLGVSTTFYTTF